MSRVTDAERQELSERLSDAEHNGESGVCNWCGVDSDNLTKDRTALISDVSHTLYECEECGERTATYYWNGTTWRAAAATDRGDYTVVAGKTN